MEMIVLVSRSHSGLGDKTVYADYAAMTISPHSVKLTARRYASTAGLYDGLVFLCLSFNQRWFWQSDRVTDCGVPSPSTRGVGRICHFRQIKSYTGITQKQCKSASWLMWKVNKKSYTLYRTVALPMTLSDPESHFTCLKSFHFPYLGKCSMHLETLLPQTTNRKSYRPMILRDISYHSPIASLLKCSFLYSCTGVDNISADIALNAVPLRLLSFLLTLFTSGISKKTKIKSRLNTAPHLRRLARLPYDMWHRFRLTLANISSFSAPRCKLTWIICTHMLMVV